jgi:hypothetical protein
MRARVERLESTDRVQKRRTRFREHSFNRKFSPELRNRTTCPRPG